MKNQTGQRNQKAFLHLPPTKEFSTEEARQNPFPILKQLRETTPIRFDEQRQVWDVFRHEDVSRILKDAVVFSGDLNYAGELSTEEGKHDNLIAAPPARHRELRGLTDKAFTPKEVTKIAPRIRQITNELLDRVVDQEEMRAVYDYASPIPVIVIAEMLGVPTHDHDTFKRWSDAMLTGVYDDSEISYQEVVQNQQQASQEIFIYLSQILEQRKVEPREDLISKMWYLNLEEKVMSEQGLLGFFMALLVAGNETTRNLISSSIRILCEYPELAKQVQDDRSLIPAFVEEVLRFYPASVSMLPRLATADVDLHGHQIKAGDMLHVWVAAANRDETKFEHAGEFRLDRTTNPHLTFGFGMHSCLGAPLARLEAQIAVETLLDRISDLKRKGEGNLELLPNPMFISMKEYPVTFKVLAKKS